MKRFGIFVLVFFLVNMLSFNMSFAEPNDKSVVENQASNVEVEDTEKTSKDTSQGNVPFEVETVNVNTEKIEEGIDNIKEKSESMMYKIIKTVGDISLPICFLLVLWGSVLYFILGIRNLYKKRQGLLLMWGAITFVVIAKVMVLVGWFIFEYKA